jgi:hypothetical protein
LTAFLQMRFLLRHWGLVRGIVILVASAALAIATAMEVSSGRGWPEVRPTLLVGALVFSFCYCVPFLIGWWYRNSTGLMGNASMYSTWFQVIWLWLSVFSTVDHSVEVFFPTGSRPWVEGYAAVIGYCTGLGSFLGAGNFLAKAIRGYSAAPGGGDAQ